MVNIIESRLAGPSAQGGGPAQRTPAVEEVEWGAEESREWLARLLRPGVEWDQIHAHGVHGMRRRAAARTVPLIIVQHDASHPKHRSKPCGLSVSLAAWSPNDVVVWDQRRLMRA